MGIQDRDYMKRRPNREAERGAASDPTPGAFLRRLYQREPRLSLYLGLILGGLVILALVAALFSGGPTP
jgi:hypothetical protein